VGLTKAVALEYADQNIRVNVVGPSYIKTPMLTNAFDEEGMKVLEKFIPMNRLGEASEVAELILWLSSSKSSFVTGSYYGVDGGYLAQ
jgi:NAD(P)-dependent dehydrogenase (short-subunit alcohol dehydrogenase family)